MIQSILVGVGCLIFGISIGMWGSGKLFIMTCQVTLKMAKLMVAFNTIKAYFWITKFQSRNKVIVAPNGYNGEEPIQIINRINDFQKDIEIRFPYITKIK